MPQQKAFTLEIITPNGTVFSDKVVYVDAPGKSGRFGVMVNHISSITLLKVGVVHVEAFTGNRHFTISGGVAEVHDNDMKILTKAAEDVDKIDLDRALRAQKRAQKRLDMKNIDHAAARDALIRAENRIQARKS